MDPNDTQTIQNMRRDIDDLQKQCRELRDTHDALLELKWTTKELLSWKTNSEKINNEMSKNFLKVSTTLEVLATNQQHSTEDIQKLTRDVESVKSSSKITIKDIVQHIVFAVLGAFITLVIAIIQGGKM